MYFEDAIIQLENLGLTDVILPFLLIFVIIFAILQRVQILGDDSKNMNTILALIMGLLVVIPHVTGDYPGGADPVEILNSALPSVSLVIVAILMFFILAGAFGLDSIGLGNKSSKTLVAIFAIAVVGWIFGNSAGWWGNGLPAWLDFLTNPDFQAAIVMILVFGLIIMFVTGGGTTKTQSDSGGAFLRWLDDAASGLLGGGSGRDQGNGGGNK